MHQFEKIWKRIPTVTIAYLGGYAAAYLMTRLVNLTLLPAHFDELAQLKRLAEFVGQGNILVGLTDNLKWFQLWLMAGLWWLPADPLWIGRFTSTLVGLVGGLGCYALAVTLYRRRSAGVFASLLYFFVPYVYFYDRITMPDGLLASLGIWTMIFSLRAVQRQQFRWAVAAGVVISAASLTKLAGLAYLVVPLAAFILFSPRPLSKRSWQTVAAMYAPTALGVAILLFALNSQNAFVYTTKIAGQSGLDWQLWITNSQSALSWVVSLMTAPLFGLAVVGIVRAVVRLDRAGLFLLVVPAVVSGAFIAVSSIWYPRYLLPVAPSLLLLGAWVLADVYQKLTQFRWGTALFAAGCALLLFPGVRTDFWLLVDPPQALLHPDEQRQYITGWPNTYRLGDAAQLITRLAQKHDTLYLALNSKSSIVTEGLRYYFDQPSNVEIVEFDPFSGEAVQTLNGWALEKPTFLILNPAREKGLDDVWTNSAQFIQGQKLAGFERPGGQTSIEVYQWLSIPAMAERWAVQSGVTTPLIVSRYSDVVDSTGAATFTQFSQKNLSQADFVLIDADTLAAPPPALTTQQPNSQSDWLRQLPADWAFTLSSSTAWFLFRSETNAPPQHPLRTTLGNTIDLIGFDLSQPNISANQSLHLILHWQARQTVSEDYIIFTQLLGPDGLLVAQQDTQPFWPTNRWHSGQRLADRQMIPLSPDIPAGAYQLIVGMYQPGAGQRLPAYRTDGQRWPDDAVLLTKVVINPASKQ